MRRVLAVHAAVAAVLVISPLPAAHALSCVGYPTHAEFVAASASGADHLFTGRVVRRHDVRPTDHGIGRSWAYDVDVVESLKGGASGRVTVLAPSDADVAHVAGYSGPGLRLQEGMLTFFATYSGFNANVLCGTLTTQDDVGGRTEEVRRALGLPPGAPPTGPSGPSGPSGGPWPRSSDPSSALPGLLAAVAAAAAVAALTATAAFARHRRPVAA